MILNKINIDELKLAESDITRSVYAMLPQELKDVVKDHAPAVYNPPVKTQVSVNVAEILAVSEIDNDTVFCKKYGVESYFRVWFKNGLSWYVDGSLEPCHYEELLMRLNH